MSTYDYSTDGFSFTVLQGANSLTTGTKYRFRYRSYNAMGYSDYSDSIRIGLGPLPTTPLAPTRHSNGNSPTSIGLSWTALTSQTLEVLEYVVYRDDGNAVDFEEVYRGSLTYFTATGLTSGIDYSFTVQAVNFNGAGSESPATKLTSCVEPDGV